MPTNSQAIYTGIEIGTSSIKVAICSLADDGGITLLGWGEAPSLQVIKGEVKDRETVCEQVARAVKQAEDEAHVSVPKTFVALSAGGRNVTLERTIGRIDFGNENTLIEEEDIIKADRQAEFKTKDELQAVDMQYTRFYCINNDEILLAPPIGSFSTFLEVHNESIVFNRRHLDAYVSIVMDVIDRQLDAVAYTPSALALATFHQNADMEASDGCLLIDIGAGVTSYVLYTSRDYFTMGQITVGCDHAANDLAINFVLPINSTRTILRNFANLHCSVIPEMNGRARVIAADLEINGAKKNIDAFRAEQIVQLRFQELFNIINKRIRDEDAWQWVTGGVQICGGGAQIPKIAELASTVFKRPVSVARAYHVKGRPEIVDSPANLVPFGLVRFGKMSHDIDNEIQPQDTAGKLKEFIKRIINW